MRGLIEAYYDALKGIDKYYSKESMVARVKKKLLYGNVDDTEEFKVQIDTQKGTYLHYACSFYESRCGFDLKVPYVYNDAYGNIKIALDSHNLVGRFLEISGLQYILDKHRVFCKKNWVQQYGDLLIGFYLYANNKFLTGLVGDKVVFMFAVGVGNNFRLNYVELLNDSIKVVLNKQPLNLSLEDYSLEVML